MVWIIAAAGWGLATLALVRLYQYHRTLTKSKILIGFKRRAAMQPTLLDLLKWSMVLQRSKSKDEGRTFYRNGHFSVSISKPVARSHGRARTRTLAPNRTTAKPPPRAPQASPVIDLKMGARNE